MASSPLSVSKLDVHLGYWLRYVSNHVSHTFNARVESRGVTAAEWVVLRALFDVNKINPSALAGNLGMTRGAISKLVDRLVAKKLVRVAAVKKDRRFQSVALTAAGRRLVPPLASLADQNDSEFFGHLTSEQKSDLTNLMQDIVRRRHLPAAPME